MESGKKRVLADSSSLLLLSRVDLLTLFLARYKVLLAPAVSAELTHREKADTGRFIEMLEGGKLVLAPPIAHESQQSSGLIHLGAGERETLSLMSTNIADFVLVDDRQAAQFCRKEGIPFISALLVPNLLGWAGDLADAEVKRYTSDLITVGYYSARIIQQGAKLSRAELEQFLPCSPD